MMVNSQATITACLQAEGDYETVRSKVNKDIPAPKMTSTKKVTYKQIKAPHTKIDVILHLVKIK